MQQENEMDFDIDLLEIFNLLKRKIAVIIVATLIGGILGFVTNKFFITPMYESSVNMIVNTRKDNNANVTNDNITSAQKMVSTYAIIIKSNTVLNRVIENLRLDTTYNELNSRVKVSSIDNTQVMKISIQDEDPIVASNIIKQISTIAPKIIVESVEAGSCKVISEIETTEKPVSPNVLKNTVLIAFLFMAGSMAVIIIKELMSNYIEDDDDVQKKLGLPVLGVIPEISEEE